MMRVWLGLGVLGAVLMAGATVGLAQMSGVEPTGVPPTRIEGRLVCQQQAGGAAYAFSAATFEMHYSYSGHIWHGWAYIPDPVTGQMRWLRVVYPGNICAYYPDPVLVQQTGNEHYWKVD